MLIPLVCFNCKKNIDVDVSKENVRVTKNNRHVVNVTCPTLKDDGKVCGRKITSLIGKTQYDNILKPLESLKA
jgi:DNA-directed RNA polymerase subunit N (RpoN/RPB10)